VRNGSEFIQEQLYALSNQIDAPLFEVVIADNGSSDNLEQVLREWVNRLPHLRMIDASAKLGQAYARNVATLAARGDILAFCDADDVVDYNWLAELFDAVGYYDAVCGSCHHDKLNSPNRYGDIKVLLPLQRPEGGWELFGGNFAIRREVYISAGGMDEGYKGGAEDGDFSARLIRMGYRTGPAMDAVLHARLRGNNLALFRQQRRAARESIRERLLEREECSKPRPLSLKGSAIRCVASSWHCLVAAAVASIDPVPLVAEFAHAVGEVEGHLRYRVLGSFAPRSLMPVDRLPPREIVLSLSE